MEKLILNSCENFDGIIERIIIENDKESITIKMKQWHLKGEEETNCLSILKFMGVTFQSLPDISSFNLITEIIVNKKFHLVVAQLHKYLDTNPTLILSNTKNNILDKIKRKKHIESYFFESRYCKDWLIICESMKLTEIKTIKNN
ncbi:hypothetical protein [Aquimarina algiphila]|uniref:hypothetical protein n=1 Tax=Aquimarina algiphila TaxID=2047982 RepID=UPI00232DFDF5|nr:hypothetical protein [Aquimarina algiphila]